MVPYSLAWARSVCNLLCVLIVSFSTSPLVQVGLFFVTEKMNGGKERLPMIIDARRSNALFRQPPLDGESEGSSNRVGVALGCS